MCTFHSERLVAVCDIAIEHVREEVDSVGAGATYRPGEGRATLVEAGEGLDLELFGQAVLRGMGRVGADAQGPDKPRQLLGIEVRRNGPAPVAR